MEYTKLRNLNRGYMKLHVWQKAIELHQLIWKTLEGAKGVDLRLRSQILDASQSVSANIAEGYGRRSVKEYIQFLYVTSGSMAELMTRLIGLKVNLQISGENFEKADLLHYEVENKLVHLIESLEKKKLDGTWTDHIAEDLAEYNPRTHHSSTPSLQHSQGIASVS